MIFPGGFTVIRKFKGKLCGDSGGKIDRWPIKRSQGSGQDVVGDGTCHVLTVQYIHLYVYKDNHNRVSTARDRRILSGNHNNSSREQVKDGVVQFSFVYQKGLLTSQGYSPQSLPVRRCLRPIVWSGLCPAAQRENLSYPMSKRRRLRSRRLVRFNKSRLHSQHRRQHRIYLMFCPASNSSSSPHRLNLLVRILILLATLRGELYFHLINSIEVTSSSTNRSCLSASIHGMIVMYSTLPPPPLENCDRVVAFQSDRSDRVYSDHNLLSDRVYSKQVPGSDDRLSLP